MRLLAQIALCCLFAGGAMAQRGGGHGGGGGGGFGGHGGGIGGGSVGGFRGGAGYGGFRGGFGNGGYRGGFGYGGFGWGGYWPYYGLGYGYWPGYFDFPDYYDSYPYASYPYGSVGYNTSPNVTVVYPQTPAYVAHPVMHEYDQYGQEIKSTDAGGASSNSASSAGNGSPVYLIAFQNHTIQAAAAYWVDGKTLHYVTLQHEEKQAPLDTVDRGLSQQLNTERRVQFQLPAQ
jgi:hypothetical protein